MNDKRYQEIPLDKIIIPKERARATFTPEQEEELRASIKENGFNIPILVRPIADGKYELIDGEHRIKVVTEMGWEKIPAIITTADEKRASVLNFLANTARGTQNPIDISEALNRAKAAGASEEELAAATGHTKDWVVFYLKLKELPDVYKKALREMKLTIGAVKEALRLPTPEEVDYLLGQQLIHNWPVGVVHQMVNNRLAELEAAQKRADLMGEEPKIEEPDYSELAQYDECWYCKRRVPRGSVYMHLICTDCKSLLDYILAHIPNPEEALDYVYKALQTQMEKEQYEKLKAKFEPKTEEIKKPPKKEAESPLPYPTEKKFPFPISSEEIDREVE